MSDKLFRGVFDSQTAAVISVTDFLLCVGVALGVGIVLATVYALICRCTKSFATALAVLPAVVCVVIMMVNGNIGAGVAVAGAFSLVRFRSAPGTAREICAIFLAMGIGLVAGMGYLGYAVLFALIVGGVMLLLLSARFGEKSEKNAEKVLKITIPEDLNYSDIFDDLFEKYTSEAKLKKVKTSNMGSLYKLTYDIKLREKHSEKAFIDELRCRNGNLEIAVYDREDTQYEL